MTNYELLLEVARKSRVSVYDNFDLNGNDSSRSLKGLYITGNIAIDKSVDNASEKSCVLAEELGHHYTSAGNILDQSQTSNRKQEFRARMWAYDKMIGLNGIVKAFKHGCRNRYEMAEYLDVTEPFLQEALQAYKSKYGTYTKVNTFIIYFSPALAVLEIYEPNYSNIVE